jgi:hypothetical protein
MKKTKIKITLDEIDKAIKDIDKYKNELLKKEKLFLERLADIGVREASVRFTTAMYDGTNNTEVTLDTTDKGYVIIAEGESVAFIEFGAGVYHNTAEPYPNTRPNGIVGIGEYGKGKGKQRAWGYKDETGELVITRGNPAAMPMWYASEEMKNAITKIAREVFG